MKEQASIIIGCMSWGQWGKQLSIKEQTELIAYCIAEGHHRFDHADIYGDYTSESEFGLAFAKCGISRAQIHLTTKCGIQLVSANRNNKVKHYNYTKEYIISSVEESLRKLGTDYLDSFLLHRPSPLMQADEVAEAIMRLRDAGKIKQFGVSNFAPAQVELLAERIAVDLNQVEYSLTQPKAMYDGTLDQGISKQMMIQAWSPTGSIYKTNDKQTQRIRPLLGHLAQAYNTSENTLLLAWILKHPAAPSPVIGTTNKERIREAKQALAVDLKLEDWFHLLEASTGHEVD